MSKRRKHFGGGSVIIIKSIYTRSKFQLRTDRSLINRWSIIQQAVNKFSGFLAQIEQSRPSGVNEQDKGSIKRKQPCSSSASKGNKEYVNLDDENPNSNGTDLPRPMGKKAEKEKVKKEKGNQVMEIWVEEKRKMHDEKMKLNEHKATLLAQDIDMEKKKFEMQQRQEDLNIMMIDTSKLCAVQKEYVESLQAEIIAKRGGF